MTAIPALFDPVLQRSLAAALAIILLTGAWQKLRDPVLFAAAVENYRLLPESLVAVVARLLPWWEAAAGALLLLPDWRPLGATLAITLLLTVTAAVAINVLRGHREIDCGCGGLTAQVGDQTLNWGLVVRNLLMIAAGLLTLAGEVARETVWIDYLSVAGGTLGLTGLYLAANQLLANRPRLEALRNY